MGDARDDKTDERRAVCGYGGGGGCQPEAARHETGNDLNVFPIPDGDTGDNMLLTIESGAIGGAESTPELELSTAAQTIADKMLLGAQRQFRVILSQVFLLLIVQGTVRNGSRHTEEFSPLT